MTETNTHTAAYWEGYQCCQTRQPCKYQPNTAESSQWAEGYGQAVSERLGSHVWYRSRTIKVSMAICLVGLIMLGMSFWGSGTNEVRGVAMGAGGGLTLNSLLNMWLRTVSSGEQVTWTQGWSGQGQ